MDSLWDNFVHADSIKLLNLMFCPGEWVCVSHDKFAYHSVPLESVFEGNIQMVSPNPKVRVKEVSTDSLIFVALNPMKPESKTRDDESCLKYRNFLVEIDTGDLKSQIAYIKQLGMPYSACVFSGNKSMHFLISLDEDLPNEKVYRNIALWILNIVTLADKNIQNPSRSIRLPGVMRDTGKMQYLCNYTGKVSLQALRSWLCKYEHLKPRAVEVTRKSTTAPNFDKLKPWIQKRLVEGLDPTQSRNSQWFSLALNLALANFSDDDIMTILGDRFTPERDFTKREWLTAIKSGIKTANKNRD